MTHEKINKLLSNYYLHFQNDQSLAEQQGEEQKIDALSGFGDLRKEIKCGCKGKKFDSCLIH